MATPSATSDDAAAARAEVIERALTYPFPRLDRDFLFTGGEAAVLPADYAIPKNKTAVLGYGSNAAPSQLLRKYGKEGIVPVLSVEVSGLDAVYAPWISHYGCVPATVSMAHGVRMRAAVTLLSDAELERMHATEQGYLYCRLRRNKGVSVTWRGKPLDVDVYAYVAPKLLINGQSVALTEIPARGRTVEQKSQREINEEVLRITGRQETLDDFVARNVAGSDRREAVLASLEGMRDEKTDECWEVLDSFRFLPVGWDEPQT